LKTNLAIVIVCGSFSGSVYKRKIIALKSYTCALNFGRSHTNSSFKNIILHMDEELLVWMENSSFG
jgi:hypothetical protein